jgi:phosphomannomutase
MRQLAALMRSVDADLGAALNVDGDRVGFVTSDGTALSEECALPLVARHILRRRQGAVVANLSTSRMVEMVAREHGCECVRTMVGEGHVMDRALTERAALGGEGNGGIGILPHAPTFDALLTLATILEALAVDDCDFDSLAARVPKLHIRKAELPCGPESVYRTLDSFRERYADTKPDLTDGIRFDWPDAWLHIRASNTEPLLRVIAEADTEDRADLLFEQTLTVARRAVWVTGGR